MARTIKGILKFLLPEYQIIATINERGFIARTSAKSPMIHSPIQDYNAGMVQQQTAPTISTAQPQPGTPSSPASPPAPPLEPQNITTDDNVFTNLAASLKKYWVGSERDLDAICKAFQRPYVKGFDNKIPKNGILLIGENSRGKTYAVKCISELLRQKKTFRYADVSILDFNDYAADTTNALFLSDLYKALNETSEAIVFENVEKASMPQLDIIYQLLTEGTYKLSQRYMMNNGSLIQVTGTLNTGLISNLGANGKFFVFTTTVSQAKILSFLGNKIVKELGDIIVLDPIMDEQIRNLTYTLCLNMANKCRDHLHIILDFDETLIDELGTHYRSNQGIRALANHIDDQLYDPLTEMKLQKKIGDNEKLQLSYDNGYCIVTENHEVIHTSVYQKDFNSMELEDVRQELAQVIGLAQVKEYVLSLENNLKVQQLRAGKGLKSTNLSMHMIFAGNPGTGKTTIARIVAKYLKAIGVLSSGHLCEVTRADLVGQYAGHTAVKTTDVIKSALGGVLFIDEAYSLHRGQGDVFGIEAIDALVKGMEDHRDDLVVILAGYEQEMQDFLKANSGLQSRFPNVVHFADYTIEEMCQIADVTAKAKGYKISDLCAEGLRQTFEKHQIKGKNDSGNGRLVRNLIEDAILKQSQRIIQNPEDNMELLIPADFGFTEQREFDLEKSLAKVIGMEKVKKYIRSLNARIKVQNMRKHAGLKTDNTQTLHMIFAGNPGTGKTMMARTVANVLYNLNVIPSNKLIETDRSGLVAGYVGQTAIKTRKVIESALGGVLFIDEAYSLAQGGKNDFGQEAIDTLVKMMDDNRDQLVVILAGYNEDMHNFLNRNAGLQSRFANIIEFPDYTTDELMKIAENMYADNGYVLDADSKTMLREKFAEARLQEKFGNGRYVRNVFEKSINNQALRLSDTDTISKDALLTITKSDIQEV